MAKRLSQEEKKEITQCFNNGISINKLSERFNCTKLTISRNLKKILGNSGSTEVNLIVNNQNKKIHYVLQNPRKLDYNLIKLIKTKEYVKKISV